MTLLTPSHHPLPKTGPPPYCHANAHTPTPWFNAQNAMCRTLMNLLTGMQHPNLKWRKVRYCIMYYCKMVPWCYLEYLQFVSNLVRSTEGEMACGYRWSLVHGRLFVETVLSTIHVVGKYMLIHNSGLGGWSQQRYTLVNWEFSEYHHGNTDLIVERLQGMLNIVHYVLFIC